MWLSAEEMHGWIVHRQAGKGRVETGSEWKLGVSHGKSESKN